MRFRPLGGRSGVRVEVFGAYGAGCGALVIAGHHGCLEPSKPRDALRRTRTVADAVAKRPDGVDGTVEFGVSQDSLQSSEIGVDVGDDEVAHGAKYTGLAMTDLQIYNQFAKFSGWA